MPFWLWGSPFSMVVGGSLAALGTAAFTGYKDLGRGECLHNGMPPPSITMAGRALECQQLCDLDATCSGYSIDKSEHCVVWKASNLMGGGKKSGGAHCRVKSSSMTYSEYVNFNALNGAGAENIDSDETAPKGLTAAQCQQHCDQDPMCDCVAWRPNGNHQCSKRRYCNPLGFKAGTPNFHVLLKPQCHTFVKEGECPSPRCVWDSNECIKKLPFPAWGPGPTAKPEELGLSTSDLKAANDFISKNVKGRECFLLAKNGQIVYEVGDMSKIWKGYSMTKTLGFFLVLMAASKGELDLDADITQTYGLPSPKTYAVTPRMMMSMVLGGETGPGEMWRYDELGNMWMDLLPKVLLAATKKPAGYWFNQFKRDIQLSDKFTFATVDQHWGFGAEGTCEDWGRLAQLVLNKGYWNATSIISPTLMAKAQQPVKYPPYNFYSNPCYGLGLWLNPNKEEYNGCCWEASRLVPPSCNNQTFMPGATNRLAFFLGLYGQTVLAIEERNVTVVSLGFDLRPIEPIQIGVYPGVCAMLGIPCNDPPKVPEPKCGESMECLGMSAQCYSGYGAWSHEEPRPGGAECIKCFGQRVRDQAGSTNAFPEAKKMILNNCPINDPFKLSNYLNCFCYDGDNVFGPWPNTTTTTPPPLPMPPVPHPYTTPAPRSPPQCDIAPDCWHALNDVRDDYGVKCGEQLNAEDCGKCLYWQWDSLWHMGCPAYNNWDWQTIGLCFCGPLQPDKPCTAKIAGVCNEYHTDVTIDVTALTTALTSGIVQAQQVSACSFIGFTYQDNYWGDTLFHVTQTGCQVVFSYEGTPMSGTLSGNALSVVGWEDYGVGTVMANGNVEFSWSVWLKQVMGCSEPNSGCPCIGFGYIATSGDVFHVMQTGCDVSFVKADTKWSGKLSGNTLHVKGWANAGTVQANGNLNFHGAFQWFRQGCTASAGGTCQVNLDKQHHGISIPDCTEHRHAWNTNTPGQDCWNTDMAAVVSSDHRTNFRMWSNSNARSVEGNSGDADGQPAGNIASLAHTCGIHSQWSVVVDKNGEVSLFPSENGFRCPTTPLSASAELVI